MPGFTTHYLFGIDACRRLTSTSMHNMIRRDHSAYALGLQGPDLFFYYLPSYLMHRKNIGDLAHRKDTVQFFANLLQRRLHLWIYGPLHTGLYDSSLCICIYRL